MLRPWFTYPLVLHLLWLLPVLALLGAFAWRRRQRALALLGPMAVAGARRGGGQWQRGLRSASWALGFILLVLAVAGPRWGRHHEPALASGRDLVAVLDLSRSMLARDVLPSRLERAKEALLDLSHAVERRGGHRLALVVFAARPRVACPLTHDYEHFRLAVAEQDAAIPHPDIRVEGEQPQSGTRIGTALSLAARAHDPRYRSYQDILLLSDGDDPARDDEWRDGAELARKLDIPVHVIGIGDPDTPSTVPGRGDEPLRHNGEPVLTRLEEAGLREIARGTRGTYTPARTQSLHLGELFHEHIEAAALREESDGAITVYQPRHAWFFAAALALLTLEMLLGRIRLPTRQTSASRPPAESSRTTNRQASPVQAALLLMPCLCCLVSAAPLAEKWQTALRQAANAYARGDFEQAARLCERAEERGTNPGLVAFNKAAALYQLGLAEEGEPRRRELLQQAERHYRQCLEDATGRRRARALFDLGNALLQQAGAMEVRLLERAIEAYDLCLREAAADNGLGEDARFNLELAKAQWLRANARRAQAGLDPESSNPNPPTRDPKHGPGTLGQNEPGRQDARGKARLTPGKSGDPNQAAATTQPAPAGKGEIPPLPDEEELARLTPEEIAAHLREAAERIERERAEHWRRTLVPASRKVKDW